jgi:periplasmic copper chaperone A
VRKTIALACATTALAAPAIAQAHVTLRPDEAPAGGFARLDVRVPNERDDASTTKVEVKFPPGFEEVSIEPVPGWTAKVTKSKSTEQVSTITWTGTGPQGRISPGEFRDFGLSVGLPDEPGKSLTFKALQTYSSGEVVRWIGVPDSDEPAPQVKLTSPARADTSDDTGAPTWLAVVALVLGAGGLLAGAAGLTAARRRTA